MQVAIQLSNWQLATLVVLQSSVTLVGWLSSNARLADIRANMNVLFADIVGHTNSRFAEVNSRLVRIANRIDALTSIVKDIDKRVVKIEERLHIEPQ